MNESDEEKANISRAVQSCLNDLNAVLAAAAKAGLTVEMTEYNLQAHSDKVRCVSFSAKVFELKEF